MSRPLRALVLLIVAGAFMADGWAQTGGLGLRPMRLELEVTPGKPKTASFMIEAPPSDVDIRGRLILSLTDWTIQQDTSISYFDAGTQPSSASSWIAFSPADLTITSGQERMIRVTADPPIGTPPGVYTSGIFVQERPPAKQPQPGEQLMFYRFRYLVTLYVIVQPVRRQGEAVDVQLITDARGMHLTSQLKNRGTSHLRPYINWIVRSDKNEIISQKNVEATVLLPAGTNNESLQLQDALPPGRYDIEAQVDFHDGGPIQALKRSVEIGAHSTAN
jgi:hypothetical protein